MEWRCPKPYGGGSLTGTVLPLNRQDQWQFMLRIEQLGEEMAGEILLEALAAVYQVESLIRKAREIDRALRRIGKSGKALSPTVLEELLSLQEQWSALQCEGKILRDGLRKPRFGKHLPRTKRSILRKMDRQIRQKPFAKFDFSPKTPANVHFRSALSGPVQNPPFSVLNDAVSPVQLSQNQAKADFSPSFWEDKMPVLHTFITEGKI